MRELFWSFLFPLIFLYIKLSHGELAQLARASALQAEGQGFEPPILQDFKKHSVDFLKRFFDSKSEGKKHEFLKGKTRKE